MVGFAWIVCNSYDFHGRLGRRNEKALIFVNDLGILFVMSLPIEVRKEATRSWKEGKGKEASVKEGTNSMIMEGVSELHMLELVGKAMVVGHVLYVSSGKVMGSLVVIM
jgi:hypothetical protein